MDILARKSGQAGRSSHNLVSICYAETRSSFGMCKLRQEMHATLIILAHLKVMMMGKVIKIPPYKEALEECVKILKNGGHIIYPTDTIYGIGADANNKNAVLKINKIKKRKKQTYSVIIASVKDIEKYAVLKREQRQIIKKLVPGPYTFLLKAKKKLVVVRKNIIGIRIPANKFCLQLAKIFDGPIVSTSANISGKKENYNVKSIEKDIKNKIDLIVDQGNCRYKKSSTIIDLTDISNIKIIREGAGLKKLKYVLDEINAATDRKNRD